MFSDFSLPPHSGSERVLDTHAIFLRPSAWGGRTREGSCFPPLRREPVPAHFLPFRSQREPSFSRQFYPHFKALRRTRTTWPPPSNASLQPLRLDRCCTSLRLVASSIYIFAIVAHYKITFSHILSPFHSMIVLLPTASLLCSALQPPCALAQPTSRNRRFRCVVQRCLASLGALAKAKSASTPRHRDATVMCDVPCAAHPPHGVLGLARSPPVSPATCGAVAARAAPDPPDLVAPPAAASAPSPGPQQPRHRGRAADTVWPESVFMAADGGAAHLFVSSREGRKKEREI